MHKYRFSMWKLLAAIVICGVGVIGLVMAKDAMSEKIFEFELGKTLQDTSARARLPLSGQNTHGLIAASSPMFPDGVKAKYAKSGYEVTVGPLAWVTFYADVDRFPNKIVNIATLSIDANQGLNTYAKVYDFVYSLVGQFQNGKWQRYFPEECPHLNGKDSLIDYREVRALTVHELRGYVGFPCPIDPAYKPALDQWKVMANGSYFLMWHDGQGNVAKLSVLVSSGKVDGELQSYDSNIALEFELEDSINKRNVVNREYDLKHDDADRILKVEAEKRRIRAILEQRAHKTNEATPSANAILRAKAGEPCPRAGLWQSQDAQSVKRRFEKDQPMADLHSAYGLTIWQWVE